MVLQKNSSAVNKNTKAFFFRKAFAHQVEKP